MDVIGRLARHVADLTVRLTVAEAQLAAYERAAVDDVAAREAADD